MSLLLLLAEKQKASLSRHGMGANNKSGDIVVSEAKEALKYSEREGILLPPREKEGIDKLISSYDDPKDPEESEKSEKSTSVTISLTNLSVDTKTPKTPKTPKNQKAPRTRRRVT